MIDTTCSCLSAFVASPVECRFQQADPVVYVDFEDHAMFGVTHVKLDLAFISPCDYRTTLNSRSMYNIEDISYNKLEQLCIQEYKKVLSESAELLSCRLSKPSRPKRALPILAALAPFATPIITTAVAASAAGGQATYRYTAIGSSYNRLNRYDVWKEQTEGKLSGLQKLIGDVSQEANLNREIRQSLLNVEELNQRRHCLFISRDWFVGVFVWGRLHS